MCQDLGFPTASCMVVRDKCIVSGDAANEWAIRDCIVAFADKYMLPEAALKCVTSMHVASTDLAFVMGADNGIVKCIEDATSCSILVPAGGGHTFVIQVSDDKLKSLPLPPFRARSRRC